MAEAPQLPGRVHTIHCATQQEQVRFLRSMVDRYKGNQLLVDKAQSIVFHDAQIPAHAKLAQAVAIARWVQEHVTYVNEPVETFQTPVRILTHRIGDCDDFAVLIASLLEALGIQSELVALRWRGQFRHIFARAVINGRRVPLDATLLEDVRGLPNPVTISTARGDNPEEFTA